MSIATGAMSSYIFCSCHLGMNKITPFKVARSGQPVTVADTRLEGALEGWKRELSKKIRLCKDSNDEFLRKFVPSNAPTPPKHKLTKLFDNWRPEKGKEVESYPGLIEGLTTMVSRFPSSKRPSFVDCHRTLQRYPFSAFSKNHHSTYPDIAVSFPGRRLDSTTDSPTWLDFSIIIEAKATKDEDPFKRRGLKYSKTLVQLSVNARNLMHAHGSLATFVLGLYGDILRIVRFDHACAVVSQPFDIHNDGDVDLVRRFFWQFSHPCAGDTVVGCDPTVRHLTIADQKWLLGRLELIGETIDPAVLPEARGVDILTKDGDTKPYIMYKVLDSNGRLFSRSTTVWRAVLDTRLRVDKKLTDPPPTQDDLKIRIVKEAWRQLARRPESDFYERLKESIPDEERIGLPTVVCGGDIGEHEVERWEETIHGLSTPRESDRLRENYRHATRLSALASSAASDVHALSISQSLSSSDGSDPTLPIHRPMHQTFTWRQLYGEKYWHRERSQMRLVVDAVGRPITQFRSTKEMVTAMRDSLRGHRAAIVRGGILQRDVSVGNIMIVDDPNSQDRFSGFLHDFDYSSMSKKPPTTDLSKCKTASLTEVLFTGDDNGELKERTGTCYFMALQLLAPSSTHIHEIRHDLESYYWVLLWVVLRHTDHMHKLGKGACASIFTNTEAQFAIGPRYCWLQGDAAHLKIRHNPPLTFLMMAFGKLVSDNFNGVAVAKLDYDTVFKLFDTALSLDLWPDDDAAIPYDPPDLRTVNSLSESDEVQPHVHRKLKRKASEPAPNKDPESDVDDLYEDEDTEDEQKMALDDRVTVDTTQAIDPNHLAAIIDMVGTSKDKAPEQPAPQHEDDASEPRVRSKRRKLNSSAPQTISRENSLSEAHQCSSGGAPVRVTRSSSRGDMKADSTQPTAQDLEAWGGPATGTRGRRTKNEQPRTGPAAGNRSTIRGSAAPKRRARSGPERTAKSGRR